MSTRSLLPSEDELQISVMDHLRLRKRPGVIAYHVPNEGKRSLAGHALQKRKGLLAGVADIAGLVPAEPHARPFFLELKRARKKPTDDQAAFLTAAESIGSVVGWADNLDDALSFLVRVGVIWPEARG